MKRCIQCQSQIEDQDQFCPMCGSPQNQNYPGSGTKNSSWVFTQNTNPPYRPDAGGSFRQNGWQNQNSNGQIPPYQPGGNFNQNVPPYPNQSYPGYGPRRAEKKKKGWIYLCAGLLVLGIAAGGVFGFMTTPARAYDEKLNEAQKYLMELDYSRAEDYLLDAIDIDPKQPESYQKLYELYVATDQPEKAQEVVKKAEENLPEEKKQEFTEKKEEVDQEPSRKYETIAAIGELSVPPINMNANPYGLQKEGWLIQQGDSYGYLTPDGNITPVSIPSKKDNISAVSDALPNGTTNNTPSSSNQPNAAPSTSDGPVSDQKETETPKVREIVYALDEKNRLIDANDPEFKEVKAPGKEALVVVKLKDVQKKIEEDKKKAEEEKKKEEKENQDKETEQKQNADAGKTADQKAKDSSSQLNNASGKKPAAAADTKPKEAPDTGNGPVAPEPAEQNPHSNEEKKADEKDADKEKDQKEELPELTEEARYIKELKADEYWIYLPETKEVKGPFTSRDTASFEVRQRTTPDIKEATEADQPDEASPFWYRDGKDVVLASPDGSKTIEGQDGVLVVSQDAIGGYKDEEFTLYDEQLNPLYSGKFAGGAKTINGVTPILVGNQWKLVRLNGERETAQTEQNNGFQSVPETQPEVQNAADCSAIAGKYANLKAGAAGGSSLTIQADGTFSGESRHVVLAESGPGYDGTWYKSKFTGKMRPVLKDGRQYYEIVPGSVQYLPIEDEGTIDGNWKVASSDFSAFNYAEGMQFEPFPQGTLFSSLTPLQQEGVNRHLQADTPVFDRPFLINEDGLCMLLKTEEQN